MRWGGARAAAIPAVAVALLAGGPANAGVDGGINGKVVIGPNCPGPVGDAGACDERPYDATIRIYRRSSGRRVAVVRSGADGRFLVRLRPDRYRLVPENRRKLPHAEPVNATVRERRFTRVKIYYETGVY